MKSETYKNNELISNKYDKTINNIDINVKIIQPDNLDDTLFNYSNNNCMNESKQSEKFILINEE